MTLEFQNLMEPLPVIYFYTKNQLLASTTKSALSCNINIYKDTKNNTIQNTSEVNFILGFKALTAHRRM